MSEKKNLIHRALEQSLSPDDRLSTSERQALSELLREGVWTEEMSSLRNAQLALQSLPPVTVSKSWTAELLQRLSVEREIEQLQVQTLVAPPGFARKMAENIAMDVTINRLPKVSAPLEFARTVAKEIAKDALPKRSLVPIYGLAVALLLVGIGIASYSWGSLKAASELMFELGHRLPKEGLKAYGLLMLVSCLTLALSPLLKWKGLWPRLHQWTSVGGFACTVVFSFGFLTQHLGNLVIPVGTIQSNIVRLNGDIVVAGHVQGHVIALGGNVVLREGAQVDGPVISVLGNIHTQTEGVSAEKTQAILGHVELDQQAISELDPTAAAALQPLLGFGKSPYWMYAYAAFLILCAFFLNQSGYLASLERQIKTAASRDLALGLLVAGIGLPLVLLGSLSNFTSTLALLGLLLLFLGMSIGMVLVLNLIGQELLPRLHLPQHRLLALGLGLGLFGLSTWVPLLNVLVWSVLGALGLGALLYHVLKRDALDTI
ncbi:MAG: polymer-forming cytoskeletal protein [Deinococcaceae bacterium]